MRNFEYMKPDKLEDALSAFQEHEDALLLAGGTDLLVGMKYGLLRPQHIIDLKAISDLSAFRNEKGWEFGALTTIRDMEKSEILRNRMPFLCQAAGTLGSVQIRNRATLGGNLCNASPAADMATMFLAMDSQVRIMSVNKEKVIPLDGFFSGPNATVLGKGEVLTEIMIPEDIEKCRGCYLKFGPRKAMDIGIVNIAVLLDADKESGLCKKARIALGAVAPTPVRAKRAEEILNGNVLSPDLIAKAAQAASGEINPISDFRASADYRKELVKILVARVLNTLLAKSPIS